MEAVSPRITIAIPFYRGLDYLASCLDSVIRQDTESWQAVVVDDCGGEDSKSVVETFNHSRITHYQNPRRLGLSGNWNHAVGLAQSEYVVLLHADDMLGTSFISESINLLDSHPQASACYCGVIEIDDQGTAVPSLKMKIKSWIAPSKIDRGYLLEGSAAILRIAIGNWIYCPSICYRTEDINQLKFDESLRFATDLDLITRMWLSGRSMVGTSRVNFFYRIHDSSQTALQTASRERFFEEHLVYQSVKNETLARRWYLCSLVLWMRPTLRIHEVLTRLGWKSG